MIQIGDFEFKNTAGEIVHVRVHVAQGDKLAQGVAPLVHRARKSKKKLRQATTAGGALVVTIIDTPA